MTGKIQFDEFVVMYLEHAHKLAGIYIKNPEDAKDVVSESIEKALRNLDTLKDPDTMKAWFSRIVINTSIDFLRKQPRSIHVDMPAYYFDDFSQLYIHDLLEVFPEEDRKIILMRFVDNYSIIEISEALDMNENTVKTRLYRTLKKLRLEITGDAIKVNVKKKNTALKKFTITIVTVLLSAMCIFNLSPELAEGAFRIPIIGDIVRIITFKIFEFKDKGYESKFIVPELTGILDPELEERLNDEFRDDVDPFIAAFEQDYLDLKQEFGDELVHLNIKSDYTVKTNDDRVISINTYIYSEVVNFEVHNFYTLDKMSGLLVTLESLFKADADYVTPISEYIVQEMERYNSQVQNVYSVGEGDGFTPPFTEIDPDQKFYINNDRKLVICFDKYQVAPGWMKIPEFVIPTEVIKDISATDLIK